MTVRSIGLAGGFVLILTLNTSVSFASSDRVVASAGNSVAASYCPSVASDQRPTVKMSTRDRLALHCKCCGTDENGHCNHQCCE